MDSLAEDDWLIGKGSPLYETLSDIVTIVYSCPVLMVSVLHPAVSHAAEVHGRVLDGAVDPEGVERVLGRLAGMLALVGGMVFGGDDADHAGASLRELHRPVAGTLPAGKPYHGGESRLRRWVWAGIIATLIDTHRQVRGFPTLDYEDQVYRGMVEIGRRLGVVDLPPDYGQFIPFWQNEFAAFAQPTETARFLLDQTGAVVIRAGFARRIPRWLWRIAAWPIRHIFTVAVTAGLPQYYMLMGCQISVAMHRAVRIHRALWRLIPRCPSRIALPLYFWVVRRGVQKPLWQGCLSLNQRGVRRAGDLGPCRYGANLGISGSW